MIGLVTLYTTVETPREDSLIYDLSKEINYESGNIIDSGIFNALIKEERNSNIENLTDYYAQVNPGADLLIIYGDKTEMFAVFYTTENTGSVSLGIGNTDPGFYETETRRYNTTFNPQGEETITLILGEGIQHTFKIKPGQTFFVILQRERQSERYVAASEPNVP